VLGIVLLGHRRSRRICGWLAAPSRRAIAAGDAEPVRAGEAAHPLEDPEALLALVAPLARPARHGIAGCGRMPVLGR
jgi:hypothetical protein